MQIPRNINDSLEDFNATVDSNRLGIVAIPSSSIPDLKQGMLERLGQYGIIIPDNRVWEYVPPPEVGQKHNLRDESVPIVDKSLTYLIMDDQIQDGTTLDIVLNRLNEQKVDVNKIWAFIGIVSFCEEQPFGPYLDRVQVFLDYVKAKSLSFD